MCNVPTVVVTDPKKEKIKKNPSFLKGSFIISTIGLSCNTAPSFLGSLLPYFIWSHSATNRASMRITCDKGNGSLPI